MAGAGADTLNLDTAAGSGRETTFEKAFLARLGNGFNSTTLGGGADNYQVVVFHSTAVIHHGTGLSVLADTKVYFPFGTALQDVV
jgi:hypothetical protein